MVRIQRVQARLHLQEHHILRRTGLWPILPLRNSRRIFPPGLPQAGGGAEKPVAGGQQPLLPRRFRRTSLHQLLDSHRLHKCKGVNQQGGQ